MANKEKNPFLKFFRSSEPSKKKEQKAATTLSGPTKSSISVLPIDTLEKSNTTIEAGTPSHSTSTNIGTDTDQLQNLSHNNSHNIVINNLSIYQSPVDDASDGSQVDDLGLERDHSQLRISGGGGLPSISEDEPNLAESDYPRGNLTTETNAIPDNVGLARKNSTLARQMPERSLSPVSFHNRGQSGSSSSFDVFLHYDTLGRAGKYRWKAARVEKRKLVKYLPGRMVSSVMNHVIAGYDFSPEMPNALHLCNISIDINVPPQIRERRIALGDVGAFDSSGNFQTFFNIFMTSEENIGMEYSNIPISFQPLNDHLPKSYYRTFDADYVADSSGGYRLEEKGPDIYSFICTSRTHKDINGAHSCAVVLPNGYIVHKFKASAWHAINPYLNMEANKWYNRKEYRIPLQEDIPAGSLLLIDTCYKARTWARAICTATDITSSQPPEARLERIATSPENVYRWIPGRHVNGYSGPSRKDLSVMDSQETTTIAIHVSSISDSTSNGLVSPSGIDLRASRTSYRRRASASFINTMKIAVDAFQGSFGSTHTVKQL